MWARKPAFSRTWQRVVAVAALATAGAVVLVCLPRSDPIAPANAESAPSQHRESTPIDSTAPADNVVRSAAEIPAAPGGAAAQAPAFVLNGRVVVLDEHGSEHPTESGTVTLLFEERHELEGLSIWNVPVPVERGAWTLALPIRFPEFRVQGGLLGSKGAAGSPEPIAVSDDEVVLVRVQWQVPTKLRVVASENGQDLGGVRIVRIAAHEQTKVLVPLRARNDEDGIVLVADGTSPLQFDPHSQYPQAMLWVGAKGRAWSRLLVSTTDLVEHTVRLDPGGDVAITFAGPPVPAKAFLRVRRVAEGAFERVPYVGEDDYPRHGAVVAEVEPGHASSVQVNGLPVGPFEVALEMGSDYGSLQLGTAKVVVEAGATAHATIVVRDDVVVPPSVPIRGTLQLPAAARSVSLLIEPERATRPWQAEVRLQLEDLHPIGSALYRWDAGNLAAGEYEIEVVGYQHFFPLTVAPGQNGELAIVVPARCEVVVKVLDADTGRLVPFGSDEQLRWTVASWREVPKMTEADEELADRLAAEHGYVGWSSAQRFRSDYCEELVQPDGAFRFAAPPGWIEVRVESSDFVQGRHEQELVAGRNEIVMQAKRACGLELVWKDGEAVVDGGSIELQSADGKYLPHRCQAANRCGVFGPGTFTLIATPPEGYEPVPPRSVTVVSGCWTPVEIALQRQR